MHFSLSQGRHRERTDRAMDESVRERDSLRGHGATRSNNSGARADGSFRPCLGRVVLRIWDEGTLEVKVNTLRTIDPSWDDDERVEHFEGRLEQIDGVRFSKGNRRQWPHTQLAPPAHGPTRKSLITVITDVVRTLPLDT